MNRTNVHELAKAMNCTAVHRNGNSIHGGGGTPMRNHGEANSCVFANENAIHL